MNGCARLIQVNNPTRPFKPYFSHALNNMTPDSTTATPLKATKPQQFFGAYPLGKLAVLLGFIFFIGLPNSQAWAAANWEELSPKQQELLRPLQREWSGLSASQRDKWLRLGQRYETQPSERQALMRERVGNWNELSPQDRARARENFRAMQNTQKGERNSQWNRYQTLERSPRDNRPTPEQRAPGRNKP